MWITPVIDRTKGDVDIFLELRDLIKSLGWDNVSQSVRDDWLYGQDSNLLSLEGFQLRTSDLEDILVESYENIKGAYNNADMNRVENNTGYLSVILNSLRYYTSMIIKDDWERVDIPNLSDAERYLNNIQILIDAFYVLSSTPTLPDDLNNFSFEEANAIEQILLDINSIMIATQESYRYAGTFYAGSEGGLI